MVAVGRTLGHIGLIVGRTLTLEYWLPSVGQPRRRRLGQGQGGGGREDYEAAPTDIRPTSTRAGWAALGGGSRADGATQVVDHRRPRI